MRGGGSTNPVAQLTRLFPTQWQSVVTTVLVGLLGGAVEVDNRVWVSKQTRMQTMLVWFEQPISYCSITTRRWSKMFKT